MKQFLILASTLIFASCVDIERGNPEDPGSRNYNINRLSSSLSVEVSSSSEPSSSSSSVPQSSSSVVASSSSVVESSSSSMLSSSSSALPSSSSVAASSSSVVEYSSSSMPSSSSVITGEELCTGFVDGIPREHYGKNKAQFCDSRDGKKYVYVKIGEQYWMAENLNYNASGSRCYDDNTGGDSQGNCAKYGRLYNWATAMANSASSTANPSGVRGVCPSDWHLPSDAEWNALMTAVGGLSTAGKHLKARDGWNSCGPSGSGKSYSCEDTYGFAALPGGYGFSDGSFSYVGNNGRWWSATELNANYAYSRYMYLYDEDVSRSHYGKSHYWFSVRCLQD